MSKREGKDLPVLAEGSRKQVERTTTGHVRLKWSEKDRTVVIMPPDNDLFTMKVKEVIEVCNLRQQNNESESQFNESESQFNNLKNILGNWVHDNKDKIAKAFVTIRDTRVLFVAVTKNVEYDGELEDELTKLDWEIAQSPLLSAIPLSVQSLPKCDSDIYDAFLSPLIILEYIG